MKRLIIFVLAFFVITIFSGCMPTNQAEQSLDFVFGKPRILGVEPRDGVENIDLNSEIKITFNKEIDEATLNNKNVNINYLNKDLKFNVNPFLNSEYKYENKTLTIKPAEEFLPNQLIEVKLTSGIKNREGGELSHSGRGGESDEVRYVFRFRTEK
jgi:hypothetical protein